MSIKVRLDVLLAKKRIQLKELANKISIDQTNLSKLKNEKVKAIRFSTLNALCKELDCQPGDLLEFEKDEE